MGSSTEITNLSFQLAAGIGGMVLLTIFIILFFFVYQKRLLQEKFRAQKIEANYQYNLLRAGILAQEVERERIATDLHDSVGGLLSASKIYLDKVEQQLPEETFLYIKKKALEAINTNIQEVRTITHDLLPPSLERVGLVAASKDLCQRVQELKSIDIDFFSNTPHRFDSNKEKAIYRILQELMNNTLKHSQASRLELGFKFAPHKLKINFRDNGQGFDKAKVNLNNQSLGLKSIESRIAFLNAHMEYETSLGKGVTVNISLDFTYLEKEDN